jgi:hypothetical protein
MSQDFNDDGPTTNVGPLFISGPGSVLSLTDVTCPAPRR